MKVTMQCGLVAAMVVGAGCGGSADGSIKTGFAGGEGVQANTLADGSIDDRSMCEWQGMTDRDVTETAGPGSFQPNVRRVWKLIGTGADQQRILICREIDTNLDGVKDVARRYNDDGESLKEEADSNYDGRIDTWITFATGRLAEVEVDTTGDGKPDEWKYYDEGRLNRVKRDTNQDGKPDVWEIYRKGQLERMGVDVDGDERVDRWDHDSDLKRKLEEEARKEEEKEDKKDGGGDEDADAGDETEAPSEE